jgi:sporulation protein YlmC with PRC-barrel domain
MSRQSQASSISGRSIKGRTSVNIGIVLDVIINEDHPTISDTEVSGAEGETRNTSTIGSAQLRKLDDVTSHPTNLRYYAPHDYSILDLPLIGETVEIIVLPNGNNTYRRLTTTELNTGNFSPDIDKLLQPEPEKESDGGTSEYKTTSQTGTPNSSAGESESPENEYFEPTQINPLQFYEGDKVIQSRFGQSIRFSGYNNTDNVLAPTIVMRNRQGNKSLEELKDGTPLYEDIVDDGSTIVLSSGEHLLEFTPGQIDTPLETTPIYAEEPELKGTDQVLINSGRIILSSKDSEMLFYSKGNYSFISDGKLTIDNGLDGAEIDLNGEYRTTTNDNNMYFLGGSGEIYLNTESSAEPLSRGQTLIDILAELCDAINAQIFSTPAGPTMMGPNNRGDFNKIKSKLDTILSTLNYTE